MEENASPATSPCLACAPLDPVPFKITSEPWAKCEVTGDATVQESEGIGGWRPGQQLSGTTTKLIEFPRGQ